MSLSQSEYLLPLSSLHPLALASFLVMFVSEVLGLSSSLTTNTTHIAFVCPPLPPHFCISRSGYGSESEAEDQAAKVELPDEYGKGNHASQQSAVKLHEVGPRMTLQLVKVEEGLCDGDVMFHEYVKKTPEEVAVLRALKEQREALRKQRRAEQEANVKRKEEERSSRKKRKFVEQKVEHAAEEDAAEDDEAGMSADEPQEEEIDDAEWYRREVGEEPDEGQNLLLAAVIN